MLLEVVGLQFIDWILLFRLPTTVAKYILMGVGYFDVRDVNESWIRVWVKKGGMIVLPAGIYHRFTLDSSNYIKVLRKSIHEHVYLML